MKTPIQYLGIERGNNIYIKREDLIPFSFGGNKVRKAELFFQDFDDGDYDCVVTYGSSSSNHCRVVSNMSYQRNIECYIISPKESSEETYNSNMMRLFGASIQIVPVEEVHNTIENKLRELKNSGKKPYFIPGGGHGNIGTRAYVECYEEIREYEQQAQTAFDYIFFASGTGTTQAGLVCGQLIYKDAREIVGISIARKNPRGRDIIIDSIKEYLSDASDEDIQKRTHFVDGYLDGGYGKENSGEVIDYVLKKYGIPLDITYTGKAFKGMLEYLSDNSIKNRNVLFIHTGGTPLFFDYLKRRE